MIWMTGAAMSDLYIPHLVQSETPYGILWAWIDYTITADGLVVVGDLQIVKFAPSDKMRHKIIREWQQANSRRARRGRRGVAVGAEVLENVEVENEIP
jgi:hypothetical protein